MLLFTYFMQPCSGCKRHVLRENDVVRGKLTEVRKQNLIQNTFIPPQGGYLKFQFGGEVSYKAKILKGNHKLKLEFPKISERGGFK